MAVSSSTNGADTPFADITHFRSLIGALQYLAITRPDIQFTVNRVAQRMHQPSEHDYHCLKRILMYILALLVVVYSFDPGTWSFGVSQIQIWLMIKMTKNLHRGFSFFWGQT